MKQFNDTGHEALKELLYKIADDQLIIGHRNSEWTGLGPLIEEDIAFSSIAQDKIGQSLAVYSILNSLGEAEPDTIAFTRNQEQFKCCHLVEYPIGEYDFSLMRNFLFNHSEYLRFEMLALSSYEPLSKVAMKFRGEIKYHLMHSDTWVRQLGRAAEVSNLRMQKALDYAFGIAHGIFEEGPNEELLNELFIFPGEKVLQEKWLESIFPVLESAGLKIPEMKSIDSATGGRKGLHTKYLQPLIHEMGEVFRMDPKAEW